MAEKEELVLNKTVKKEKTTHKIIVLETRKVLYGDGILNLKKNDVMEVSEELKDRLIAAGSARAI